MQAEATVAQVVGRPTQVGAPLNARRGQRSWWVGKGVMMVAPPLACHLTVTRCYGVSGFFHRLSLLWCPLLLSLQAVFSQPRAVRSLGLHSKPPFPAPSSPSQQVTQSSGWNVQSCGVDHVCSSYFVLPSTDRLLCSPLIPQSSFSVPADFPSARESFLMWVRTAFASHRIWIIMFTFSFVSRYFLISSVISWLFSNVLFSLHVLVFLTFFSL